MNTIKLKEQLKDHEGMLLKPYQDSLGILTIGIGRNLEDKGISEAEAFFLLDNDIAGVINDLDRNLPWWQELDEVRQRVLADMCFNLGIKRLLGFVNTLQAMKEGRFDDAAYGMLQSKWAGQVGRRAQKLAVMMRTGKD